MPDLRSWQLIYNAVGSEVFQDILRYQDGILTETWGELALRKEELSTREVELSVRETELQMTNSELEHVKAILLQREKTIEEIYFSRSWRVTKPMRLIKEFLRGRVKKAS